MQTVWRTSHVRTQLYHRWRWLILSLLVLVGCAGATPFPLAPPLVLLQDRAVDVIAFGSCANQSKPQLIWNAVVNNRPDLFIFLGDNIYADTTYMDVMRHRYALLGRNEGYQRLLATTPVIATWDDHDYGANDAGAEYPQKYASKQLFLDFFGEPAASERRLRDGGIYTAYTYGPPSQRIQIILLDTRWDRTPLLRVNDAEAAVRRLRQLGPYLPNRDPAAHLLGEAQWRWLGKQLRQPATIRIIGTSIPFLQEGTGWETWSNFPADQARLLALITETGANGILFLTGDTHRAQFSKRTHDVPYPLWEVNSSGLTENVDWPAPDSSRLGGYYTEDNFGLLHIDWREADPEITMEIRDVDNDLVLQNTIRVSELQMPQ